MLDTGRADGRLVREAREGPGGAQLVPAPAELHPQVHEALAGLGIESLYGHQAQAIHSAWAAPTIVTTGTASGKSMCFNLPTLDVLCRDARARALYVYPTKALAQDQARALASFGLTRRVRPAIYDGDTPREARLQIRRGANVVLTNPDMLHVGILPNHGAWADLFANLAVVVVDEAHVYRGVFGSHVANVLRRLRRVAAAYGTEPRFLLASATIANPQELAERLTGLEDVRVIERDASPTPARRIAMWNPPLTDEALGTRRSAFGEAAELLGELVRQGARTICFIKSRKGVELLSRLVTDDLRASHPELAELVAPYRAGYTASQRRELESRLMRGELRAVITTDALELGIDIGALDVAVMAGYPGSIAATWQRAGRAGRRSGRSAAVYVASSAPLDQYMVRNPDYFFGASPEHALVNPDNLHILLDHVKCAAFELPFTLSERFGEVNLQEMLAVLAESGFVHLSDGQWQWTQESYPADAVSLRSVTSDNFVIVDTTNGERVIGETDFTSGPSTLHEKAIYLIEGQLYQVDRFDFDGRKAFVSEVACDYYTNAITYTKVTILENFVGSTGSTGSTGSQNDVAARAAGIEDDRDDVLAARHSALVPASSAVTQPYASHGEVHVVSRVVGFKKVKFYTNENVGSGELDLPEQQMHTTSYWMTIPAGVMASLPYGGADRRDGVIGLAFAMRNIAPLLLMCDSHDLGLSVDGLSLQGAGRLGGLDAGEVRDLSLEPTIFLYDNYPGGIGLSEPLYGMHADLLARTRELIEGCPCNSGCPSCVGPEGATGPLAKSVASHLLELLTAARAAA